MCVFGFFHLLWGVSIPYFTRLMSLLFCLFKGFKKYKVLWFCWILNEKQNIITQKKQISMLKWGYLQKCRVQAGKKGTNTAPNHTSTHTCKVAEERQIFPGMLRSWIQFITALDDKKYCWIENSTSELDLVNKDSEGRFMHKFL